MTAFNARQQPFRVGSSIRHRARASSSHTEGAKAIGIILQPGRNACRIAIRRVWHRIYDLQISLSLDCPDGQIALQDVSSSIMTTCAVGGACPDSRYSCTQSTLFGNGVCCGSNAPLDTCPQGLTPWIDAFTNSPDTCTPNVVGQCAGGYNCLYSPTRNQYFCCGTPASSRIAELVMSGVQPSAPRAARRTTTRAQPSRCRACPFSPAKWTRVRRWPGRSTGANRAPSPSTASRR